MAEPEDPHSENTADDYRQAPDEDPSGVDDERELPGFDLDPADLESLDEPVVTVTGDIMGETTQDISGGTYPVHEPSQVNPEVVSVTGDIGDVNDDPVGGSPPIPGWLLVGGVSLIAIVILGAAVAFTNGFGIWDSNSASSPSPSTAIHAVAYQCTGDQVTLFDNSNVSGIDNGGAPPTFSTNGKVFCLTHIQTYHWNDGQCVPPGTLGLTRVSGGDAGPTRVGPFAATASSGQNDAPNVNWFVDPSRTPPVIIDGTYVCDDSGSASWSANKQSGGLGFCIVSGIPAVAA